MAELNLERALAKLLPEQPRPVRPEEVLSKARDKAHQADTFLGRARMCYYHLSRERGSMVRMQYGAEPDFGAAWGESDDDDESAAEDLADLFERTRAAAAKPTAVARSAPVNVCTPAAPAAAAPHASGCSGSSSFNRRSTGASSDGTDPHASSSGNCADGEWAMHVDRSCTSFSSASRPPRFSGTPLRPSALAAPQGPEKKRAGPAPPAAAAPAVRPGAPAGGDQPGAFLTAPPPQGHGRARRFSSFLPASEALGLPPVPTAGSHARARRASLCIVPPGGGAAAAPPNAASPSPRTLDAAHATSPASHEDGGNGGGGGCQPQGAASSPRVHAFEARAPVRAGSGGQAGPGVGASGTPRWRGSTGMMLSPGACATPGAGMQSLSSPGGRGASSGADSGVSSPMGAPAAHSPGGAHGGSAAGGEGGLWPRRPFEQGGATATPGGEAPGGFGPRATTHRASIDEYVHGTGRFPSRLAPSVTQAPPAGAATSTADSSDRFAVPALPPAAAAGGQWFARRPAGSALGWGAQQQPQGSSGGTGAAAHDDEDSAVARLFGKLKSIRLGSSGAQ